MDANDVHELARQISQEVAIENIKYWLLLVAIALVAVYFGTLIQKYAGKRGEQLATKADFDNLLDQLKKTTETTEKIKSAVSIGEWGHKEYRTLRRQKLEEVVYLVLAASEWASNDQNRLFFSDIESVDSSPMPKAAAIVALYFPELAEPFNVAQLAYMQFRQWTGNGRAAILQGRSTDLATGQNLQRTAELAAQQRLVPEIGATYYPMVNAAGQFRDSASTLMQKIIAVNVE
jgi:hypothetical protein